MKTSVFFLAGMLIAAIVTGQNEELKEIEVTPPILKSKVSNTLNAYFQNRVEFPATEIKWGKQGVVVVEFVVTPEREVKNIEVINSVSYAIDNEVIRVLKSTSGMWIPGIINGKTVAMPGEISVVFKINTKDNFTEIAKKYMNKGNHALFVKNQPEKALKFFNQGINYLPNNETLLAVRGLCRYRLGDEAGANRDWERTKVLAQRNGNTENEPGYTLEKDDEILQELTEKMNQAEK
jgi:TonB family protein